MIDRRNGTISGKRLNKNLLESTFQIDGQSPWDLMAYIASYLEKLNYYNLQNKKDGNWKKLVENDPVIYMALIINEPTGDLDKLMREFDHQKIEGDPAKREEILKVLQRWCEKIETWQIHLTNLNEKNLAARIKTSLENVSFTSCNQLRSDFKETGQIPSIHAASISEEKTEGAVTYLPPPITSRKLDSQQLDSIIHDFRKAIAHIKDSTEKYLNKNLLSSDRHLPNNAMYIAFTTLFSTLQHKLNQLSTRHLDFYYQDILQQKISSGNPTRAIVNFDLLPTVKYTNIPKGTLLSAGKIPGSKTEIFFKTNKPILAYEAEVVNIQTLLFNSNPFIDIGTREHIISSVSINHLVKYGKDIVPRGSWFVFGANKGSIQDNKISSANTAKIGFIIGSPVLFLKEGKRSIEIQINLDESTTKQALWKLLNEIKDTKKIPLSSAFFDVFSNSFKISFSSVKEWITCNDYELHYSETENYFTIQLLLDNTYPPLAKSTEIYEQLAWPSIKVELYEFAPVYVYSFFKNVEVKNIAINVAVEEIKDVSLYNNVGKMSLGKPFEIFGPEPKIGSFLMIGHSELFKKEIDTLEVTLNWDSLPSDPGGFETYYQDYDMNITDASYKVQFSVLSNNYWLPTNMTEAPVQDLFNTTPCLTPEGYNTTILNDTSNLEFEKFSELEITVDTDLEDPLLFGVTTPIGFFKINLVAPDFGFGTNSYQEEYTEIASYNARHKRKLQYPNKPFIPKIKGVEVQYKASDILYFRDRIASGNTTQKGQGEFMHITPYILDEVIVNQEVKKHTLLPNFDAQGYLILGLKGVQSRSTISVYFHFLRSSSAIHIDEGALTWEYFSLPNWHKFDPNDIIQDSTYGFIKSGIVELLLPDVTGAERGINEEILWIRASVKNDVHNYPKIKGIYLNAVEVTCITKDPAIIGKNFALGKITKVMGDHPDIKSVFQAAESFGGRVEENYEQLNTRISERLRHKGRAVSLWDYERLILEEFDDVKIVKCTNFNEDFKPVPGLVNVVVLSTRWTSNERHYFNKGRLENMQKFLNRISSSFIDIEVRNPGIEYLLVNCIVEFKLEENSGYYRHQLNEDISEYLSPISNMDQNIGGIGGRVVPMMVAGFVERLPYIETLEKLTIEHIIREGMNTFSLGVHEGGEEINANTPWTILVPLKEHRIITIDSGKRKPDISKIGIGAMEIGVDLILGKNHHPDSEKFHEPRKMKKQNSPLPINAYLEFKNKA